MNSADNDRLMTLGHRRREELEASLDAITFHPGPDAFDCVVLQRAVRLPWLLGRELVFRPELAHALIGAGYPIVRRTIELSGVRDTVARHRFQLAAEMKKLESEASRVAKVLAPAFSAPYMAPSYFAVTSSGFGLQVDRVRYRLNGHWADPQVLDLRPWIFADDPLGCASGHVWADYVDSDGWIYGLARRNMGLAWRPFRLTLRQDTALRLIAA